MNPLASYLAVEALADVGRRYGVIVSNLADAVAAALDIGVEDEPREMLAKALLDMRAQLAAINDALDTATRSLPSGEGSD